MKDIYYEEGQRAYNSDLREKHNPYPEDSTEYDHWQDGWYDAFSYVQYLNEISDYEASDYGEE